MGEMADYYLDSASDDDDDYIPLRRKQKTYLQIEVKKIVMATAKAFLCRLDDDLEYWIPFSQMLGHDEFEAGETECIMHITDWISERLEPTERKSIFDQRAKGETSD